ncbi:hypothetical protein GCM10018785_25990 [Streptomyces longispororuber]|uniref:Uncharacterized protein n=1 Tax=Streptomyces longispororuber TaxID=68230 RepID=A0A919DL41_9ACTN|nr:hypothetical protein GCM10018785_25990 [Streptomyces longispororuber]
MSGCTRMCAAMSLYDQSLRSVISGSSLCAPRAAERPTGELGAALVVTQPVPRERRRVTAGEGLSTGCDQKPAQVSHV